MSQPKSRAESCLGTDCKRSELMERLSAVEAERDRFASESAQHFIRGREWAERAGQMEAERDALAAELERVKSAKPLTDEQIDDLLFSIDHVARDVDIYEYGLPLHAAQDPLRDAVRAWGVKLAGIGTAKTEGGA